MSSLIKIEIPNSVINIAEDAFNNVNDNVRIFVEDEIVDLLDLSIVASDYGEYSISDNWDEKTDINLDKIVDIYDLVLICRKL